MHIEVYDKYVGVKFFWMNLWQQQYDEKNIRRRVYDALNVLMAMDIISKDKKEIQWKGLPRTSLSDIEELKVCKRSWVVIFLGSNWLFFPYMCDYFNSFNMIDSTDRASWA